MGTGTGTGHETDPRAESSVDLLAFPTPHTLETLASLGVPSGSL